MEETYVLLLDPDSLSEEVYRKRVLTTPSVLRFYMGVLRGGAHTHGKYCGAGTHVHPDAINPLGNTLSRFLSSVLSLSLDVFYERTTRRSPSDGIHSPRYLSGVSFVPGRTSEVLDSRQGPVFDRSLTSGVRMTVFLYVGRLLVPRTLLLYSESTLPSGSTVELKSEYSETRYLNQLVMSLKIWCLWHSVICRQQNSVIKKLLRVSRYLLIVWREGKMSFIKKNNKEIYKRSNCYFWRLVPLKKILFYIMFNLNKLLIPSWVR